MMTARAVIGSSFGDCGKGATVDYLCQTQGAGVVVRFNAGAQAGHTVVRPNGQRHVFHHFSSGSFHGIPTYLSKFFIVNPIAYFCEKEDLAKLGLRPSVYAHPDCLVTTFADMIINQELEIKRGKDRHGSVGMGINETVERSTLPELRITMGDLWNGSKTLERKLTEICTNYAQFRLGKPIHEPDNMMRAFLQGCNAIANDINPLGIGDVRDPIFEGAQGLLLDQNNKRFYPHVTRSNTGIKNVREICHTAGIDNIEAYYISRTYLTRHGAGELPGEDHTMSFADDTNLNHKFQGRLRFAPLNYGELRERCAADFGSRDYKLVLTHMDQLLLGAYADLHFYGPTANDAQVPSGAQKEICMTDLGVLASRKHETLSH